MNQDPKWKKEHHAKKQKRLIYFFVAVVLLFFVFNLVAKGTAFLKSDHKSKVNFKFPFIAAMNSKPYSVFILRDDLNNLVIIKLHGVGDLANTQKEDLARNATLAYRAKIDKYIGGSEQEDPENVLTDYTSFSTPFKVVLLGADSMGTNLSRFEAIRLWWQLKDSSVKTAKVVDLESIDAKRSGVKQDVLGDADNELNRELGNYLVDNSSASENYKVDINNFSGDAESSKLAAGFVRSIGLGIDEITSSRSIQKDTTIFAKDINSQTAIYLANIFECDIKRLSFQEDNDNIVVSLGADFALKYFK